MSGVVSVAWPSLRTAIIGSLPIGGTGPREPKLRPATRRQVSSLMGREITPVSHRAERPEGKNVQASPAIGAADRRAVRKSWALRRWQMKAILG